MVRASVWSSFIVWATIWVGTSDAQQGRLPNTEPLEMEGDIASTMIEGIDRFLLQQLANAQAERDRRWQFDSTEGADKRDAWLDGKRERLRLILGMRDTRADAQAPRIITPIGASQHLASTDSWEAFEIRWSAFADVQGEGLLLMPKGRKPLGTIIAIPDADCTPEAISLIDDPNDAAIPFARQCAVEGYRVLVPALVDRTFEPRNGRARLTSREYIYRSAFELGRHLIAYELQKILALVDWRKAEESDEWIAVVGHGEGGLLALHAAACDPRINAAYVGGYFGNRESLWREPVDRNLFGILNEFGDAELAALIAPRPLHIEVCQGPELDLPSEGGAPGRLVTPMDEEVEREFDRAADIAARIGLSPDMSKWIAGEGEGRMGTNLHRLLKPTGGSNATDLPATEDVEPTRWTDNQRRQARMVAALDRHNQQLLVESPYVRAEFMSGLKTDSLEEFRESQQPYREIFRNDVIGSFDMEKLSPAVRSRKAYDEEKWVGYEVVLDVFEDVIAYGILLVPRDIAEGDKRPVVVCQHGLEGRPQDVVAGDHRAYHDFAAKLAERGFVTFAPQNIYIFRDRFRTLQRKANPIGKTLFSIMVPQHQQIVDWLKTLPYVDEQRIAFYGLSYGGKSAMRIPALVDDYCLSICSADFNEWVWKNASTRSRYSYVWTGEYEIFEFDLGSTFNYAEMAALIAPRPFMVERGHFDGVAPDEMVAYEFAKVRNLYAARLGIPDRCEIEWFVGPHTINGKGTFEFLHKHLKWPKPE